MPQEQGVPSDWLITHDINNNMTIHQIAEGFETFESSLQIIRNIVSTLPENGQLKNFDNVSGEKRDDFLLAQNINNNLAIKTVDIYINSPQNCTHEEIDYHLFENRIYFKWVTRDENHLDLEKSYVSVCGLFHLDTPQEFLDTYGLEKLKRVKAVTHTVDMNKVPIKDVIHYLENIPYQTYQKNTTRSLPSVN